MKMDRHEFIASCATLPLIILSPLKHVWHNFYITFVADFWEKGELYMSNGVVL
jgi:hypothetical protein